jgi:hypothetical protein
MSILAVPDFKDLAKTFAEASAHLNILADSGDEYQGNLIVKALKDVNSRLSNIEKGIVDLRQEVAYLHSKEYERQKELRAKEEQRQKDLRGKEDQRRQELRAKVFQRQKDLVKAAS